MFRYKNRRTLISTKCDVCLGGNEILAGVLQILTNYLLPTLKCLWFRATLSVPNTAKYKREGTSLSSGHQARDRLLLFMRIKFYDESWSLVHGGPIFRSRSNAEVRLISPRRGVPDVHLRQWSTCAVLAVYEVSVVNLSAALATKRHNQSNPAGLNYASRTLCPTNHRFPNAG